MPFFFATLGYGLGVLSAVKGRARRRELRETKAMQKVNLRELEETFSAVRDGMGESGTYSQMVAVSGVIRCVAPLTAPLSGMSCAHYTTTVKEHYKDSDGKAQVRDIKTDVHGVDFFLEDSTGSITVHPDGATVDGDQVHCEREGNYERVEVIVPLDRPGYVIGEASDASGSLEVRLPEGKKPRFIITTKSKEDWLKENGAGLVGYTIGALFCAIVATGVVIANLGQLFPALAATKPVPLPLPPKGHRNWNVNELIPIAVGGLIVAAGFWSFIQGRKKRRESQKIVKAKQTDLDELTSTYASVRDGAGTGEFRAEVRAQGLVKCEAPLEAELSGTACVAYTILLREYVNNDEGDRVAHDISTVRKGIPFTLQGVKGSIEVDPEGARIDGIQTLCAPLAEYKGKRGDFENVETIIGLDRPVFVVGEASDASGRLRVERPSGKGSPYNITSKSPEDWAKSVKDSLGVYWLGAVVGWAFGGMIIIAMLTMSK